MKCSLKQQILFDNFIFYQTHVGLYHSLLRQLSLGNPVRSVRDTMQK